MTRARHLNTMTTEYDRCKIFVRNKLVAFAAEQYQLLHKSDQNLEIDQRQISAWKMRDMGMKWTDANKYEILRWVKRHVDVQGFHVVEVFVHMIADYFELDSDVKKSMSSLIDVKNRALVIKQGVRDSGVPLSRMQESTIDLVHDLTMMEEKGVFTAHIAPPRGDRSHENEHWTAVLIDAVKRLKQLEDEAALLLETAERIHERADLEDAEEAHSSAASPVRSVANKAAIAWKR